MDINALNSGAKTLMADFEDSDSSAPTFANMITGQLNLRDATSRPAASNTSSPRHQPFSLCGPADSSWTNPHHHRQPATTRLAFRLCAYMTRLDGLDSEDKVRNPESIAFSGKYSHEFFSQKGELRHINKLRYWRLQSVLHDKYLFPEADADTPTSFLTPMLRLNPDKRTKASELMHHDRLEGVIVQGKIDVIRRKGEESRKEREALEQSK